MGMRRRNAIIETIAVIASILNHATILNPNHGILKID